MALPGSNPPLLLTKRLTGFLHANQSPQLPTLLLTTPHGKLLAHASPQPVGLLRTHATVAASLLAIHTSSSVAVPSALPGAQTPDDPVASPSSDRNDGAVARSPPAAAAAPSGRLLRSVKPVTITVQLSGGTVVVRRLKCGLLFVCIGPAASHQPAVEPHENGEPTLLPDSPSEVDSLASAGAQTTSSLDSAGASAVATLRKNAAEIARWLDDKLGALKVPDDGVGLEQLG